MTTAILWFLMNAAIVTDWGQTRQIASQYTQHTMVYNADGSSTEVFGGRPRWREINPLIGSHPSMGRVNTYFIGSLLVHNGIMIALPKKYRPCYAGSVTAIETYFVISNDNIGIKIRF